MEGDSLFSLGDEPGMLVPFTIQLNSVLKTQEKRDLVVNMETTGTDARGSERKLNVTLTDPEDLLFLYALSLLESDFIRIKQEQCLLCDFNSFQDELLRFFQGCIGPSPSFHAKLDLLDAPGRASLTIWHTGNIKHLINVSLILTRASDRILIDHLSQRLGLHIQAKAGLCSIVRELRPRCASQEVELSKQAQQMEVAFTNLKRDHEQELATAAAKARDDMESLRSDLSKKLEAVATQGQEEIGRLREELDRARGHISELTVSNGALESSLKETQRALAEAQDSVRKLKQSEATLMDEKRSLEISLHANEGELHKHGLDLSRLSERCEQYLQQVQLHSSACDSLKADKALLEDTLKELKPKCAALEEAVAKMNTELQKLAHEKGKLLLDLRRKREVLREQERELNDARQAITHLERTREDLTGRVGLLTDKLQVSEKELRDCQGKLETSNNAIVLLNKQKTDAAVATKASTMATMSAGFATYRPQGDSPPLSLPAKSALSPGAGISHTTTATGAALAGLSRSWHSSSTALSFMPSGGPTLTAALSSAAAGASPAPPPPHTSSHTIGSSSVHLQAGPSYLSESSSYFGNPVPSQPGLRTA